MLVCHEKIAHTIHMEFVDSPNIELECFRWSSVEAKKTKYAGYKIGCYDIQLSKLFNVTRPHFEALLDG